MTISTGTPVQVQNNTSGVASFTLGITAVANTYFAIFATCGSNLNQSYTGLSDGENVYNSRGNINDTVHNQRLQSFWAGPIAAGSLTITATLSQAASFTGMLVVPVLGAGGFADSSSYPQASPTTATDAVTTQSTGGGAIYPGYLQVALSMSTADATSTAAGTGFTNLGTFWTALSYAELESFIVVAAGPTNVTSTFTAAANTYRLNSQLVFVPTGVTVLLPLGGIIT